jgi:UPF0755 protein
MRWIRKLFLLLLLLLIIGAGAAWHWVHRPMPLASPTVEISIEGGTSPTRVARQWVEAGVQVSPRLLFEWFRWSGKAKKIRAGSYVIAAGITPADLLKKMVDGDVTLAKVRLIEGWTFRQFRAALAKAEALQPTTAQMGDAEIMAALGSPGLPAEGFFFPDTYAYSKGSTDLAVLGRAHAMMQKKLNAAWAQRSEQSLLRSPQEALILASIVEKETGLAADRSKIAGVFINRLRINMPLQTDPTVIYGMGVVFNGNLRKTDLQTDTPFNTYIRQGLPPTPIAMPGKAAIHAVLHPENTQALYFVARGDGSSVFSETLIEHNQAVNQYQRGQRPPRTP